MSPILAWVFVVLGLTLFLELYLIAHGQATISERTWRLSKSYPPFIFAMGVLIGHLFWASGCAYLEHRAYGSGQACDYGQCVEVRR